MPWNALNDILIVEPDPIVRYEGEIALPDKNSEEKISPYATIISAGAKCKYPWKKGQRIVFDQFFDKPQYLHEGGKKYRLIKEHYIRAIVE